MSTPDSSDTMEGLGEIELVRRLTQILPTGSGTVCGPGDDCAVVERDEEWFSLLKTDCIVENVHFLPKTDPHLVGRKALARAVSDIAAMGGIPEHALVTIAIDKSRKCAEVEAWYEGMVELAMEFGISIVGGETSTLPMPGALLSVALTGRVEKSRCVYRGGAFEGDSILVTGKLGGSFQSGRHLDFQPRIAEARWLVEEANRRPTSMMDLSDGLAKDLPRLMEGTELGYVLEKAAIPNHDDADWKSAVGEGEDYELLITLPSSEVSDLMNKWQSQFPETSLTVIGKITEEPGEELPGGWEHFAN